MLPADFCCRPCHYNYWINVDQKIASGKMPLSWEICLIGNYSRELDDDFLFHDDLAVTPTHSEELCIKTRVQADGTSNCISYVIFLSSKAFPFWAP